jgi:hypothetical protein
MGRIGPVTALLVSLLALANSDAAAKYQLSVSPRVVGRHTIFLASFAAPLNSPDGSDSADLRGPSRVGLAVSRASGFPGCTRLLHVLPRHRLLPEPGGYDSRVAPTESLRPDETGFLVEAAVPAAGIAVSTPCTSSTTTVAVPECRWSTGANYCRWKVRSCSRPAGSVALATTKPRALEYRPVPPTIANVPLVPC